MRKRTFLLPLLVAAGTASAQPRVDFPTLRAWMDGGLATVTEDLLLEGLVLTDTDDKNIEQSRQHSYNQARVDPNSRTLYLESYDGRYGFRVGFEGDRDGRLPRYTHATLNLKGAALSVVDGGYRIDGLTAGAKVSCIAGQPSDRPVKMRPVETLSDEDLYTYVTVQDLEFVFKDGSYSNTNEAYGKANPTNQGLVYANGSMDSWATLTCSRTGAPLYLFINSRTPWRREGDGVPPGSGPISGILVRSAQIRYGDCLGRFQLRPLERSDIAIDRAAPSAFQTLLEWNGSDNAAAFTTTAGRMKAVTSETILPDIGDGGIRTDLDGTVIRGPEPNNPKVESGTDRRAKGIKGLVDHGAMTLQAPSCNWWDWETGASKSVYVTFSTEGLGAGCLLFAFSFAGGFGNAATSYAFPVWWKVEYSTDGTEFHPVGEEYEMHSLPWFWENDIDGVKYPTSWRAGMGFTEHLVPLPAELAGHREVTLRIRPARRNIATLAEDVYDRAAARPGNRVPCTVNFGAFAVRYRPL